MSGKSVVLALCALLLAVSGMGAPLLLAQGEWTCDEGPDDIVNAAQVAYEAGDLDLAYELATQAQAVCMTNFLRSLEASTLVAQIQSDLAMAEYTPEPSVATYADVSYMPDGAFMQRLDIYLPDEAEGAVPTLFMLHGWPYQGKEIHEADGIYFAAAGYAVVAANYRSPDSAGGHWAVQQDAFCALAWVHNHAAEYGFDPERIVVVGLSYGGALAATIGAVDDPNPFLDDCPYAVPEEGWAAGVVVWSGHLHVPEVVLHYPDYLNHAPERFGMARDDLAALLETLVAIPSPEWRAHSDWSAEAQAFVQCIPLYWIDGSEPPFFVMHGTADEIVSVAEARALVRALEEAGAPVEFRLFSGTHFDERETGRAFYDALMLGFIQDLFAENTE